MTRNARPASLAKVTLIALAVTGAAGLTGCTVEAQDSPTTSSTVPGSPTTTSKTTTSEQAGAAADECPAGTYDVATLTGKESVDVQGQRVTFRGTASDLSLTMDDATWKLTGDDARANVHVAGVTELDATINGTASGNYTKSGSQYQFVLEDTSGTATIALQGVGFQQLDMDMVADAIAPRGRATINCTAGGATIDSESVTIELNRAGGATGTPTSTS